MPTATLDPPATTAYHGDPAIKDKYVSRMRRHRELDELVQGKTWDGRKGCLVGCALEKYDHRAGEQETGIPEALLRLADAIFEGLPADKCGAFTIAFFEASDPGADLSLVADRLKLWILADSGLLDRSRPDVAASIDAVASLLRRRIAGDEPSDPEWSAALSAALSAARSAESAAESAAWRRIGDELIRLMSTSS